MTPELIEIMASVRRELGELIDALDHEGPAYAQRYAESCIAGGIGRGRSTPRAPAALPPIAVPIIRELVLDELEGRRYREGGARRRLGCLR